MSRIGKNPVAVPEGVTVEIMDSILNVKGKLGQQSLTISDEVQVILDENIISVSPKSKTKQSQSMWGTTRARINNMLIGVNDCLLYTSPSPRDRTRSRMPSSA